MWEGFFIYIFIYSDDGDVENKIRLLLDYTGKSQEVADPWYTGNFEITYTDIVRGCEALLESLGFGK